MKKKILFVAACITGSSLFAQLDPPLRGDSLKKLDEVVIAVTKFPQKQSQTGKVITVITQDQLQKSAGRSLSEVLNEQVGITVNGANNNHGTNQSLYVRGAHASNTLILVDGVPVYDASGETNQFDISNFSLFNVERIEILKGAQSTLYGSDAVAGVINIITKKQGNKIFNLNGFISAASYNTYKASAAVSGNAKGQSYFISYSKIHSKGFSSAYDSTGIKKFEKDGFGQDVLQGNYGFKFAKKLGARFFGNYSTSKADIDAGAFADDKDFRYKYRNFQTGTYLDYALANGTIRFNYNYNWYERKYVDDSASIGGFAKYQNGKYTGKSHFAEVYGNFNLNKNIEFLAGVDYRNNATSQNYFVLSSFGPFTSLPLGDDSIKTNQISTYASINFKIEDYFNTEVGGRWNYHSIFGNNFTWSFNPSYLMNKFKVFANLSSGYRVPSLYQLYSEFGNKDLKPEVTTSMEAGFQYNETKINTRIVVFKRNTKDAFFFYTNPVTFASKYINEDRQKDHGVEAEIRWQLSDKINIASNYTNVNGKISTKIFSGKDTTYENLYRRPAHTYNITLGYQASKKIFISTHLKTVSKSFEGQFASAPIKMKGYYILDVYGDYKMNKKFKIFADLQNITDQKYFDIRGFNSRQFNFNTGLQINL